MLRAYLREVADFLNSHWNINGFSVSDNDECYNGKGNIVDKERLLSRLKVVKKELNRNVEKVDWLLSMWGNNE